MVDHSDEKEQKMAADLKLEERELVHVLSMNVR